jgi:hypothetical protein
MAQIGCGVAQIERGVAHTGCGMAQIGLGMAKYWLDKILTSTKYYRRQNIGVDNISASTKY